MKVIVSGGTGLVGRSLVASLLADGHDTVVLTRQAGRSEKLPAGAREAEWDAASLGGWAAEVDGARAVVHLAGESISAGRWSDERMRRIRTSRLASSRVLADAVVAAARRPSVFVQASAVGWFGARGDEILDEQAAPGDGFLAEVAREWEAASAAVEELGLRRPVVRSGVVLAADDGALPLMALPFRLFAGGPVGSGEQWVSWIHLADEVAAIRFLLDHPEATGPFNLTAPEPVTNRELSRGLAGVLRRPAALRAPAFALRALLGEMADMVLHGQRVVPARLQRLGFRFRFPSLRPALADLLA